MEVEAVEKEMKAPCCLGTFVLGASSPSLVAATSCTTPALHLPSLVWPQAGLLVMQYLPWPLAHLPISLVTRCGYRLHSRVSKPSQFNNEPPSPPSAPFVASLPYCSVLSPSPLLSGLLGCPLNTLTSTKTL